MLATTFHQHLVSTVSPYPRSIGLSRRERGEKPKRIICMCDDVRGDADGGTQAKEKADNLEQFK